MCIHVTLTVNVTLFIIHIHVYCIGVTPSIVEECVSTYNIPRAGYQLPPRHTAFIHDCFKLNCIYHDLDELNLARELREGSKWEYYNDYTIVYIVWCYIPISRTIFCGGNLIRTITMHPINYQLPTIVCGVHTNPFYIHVDFIALQ